MNISGISKLVLLILTCSALSGCILLPMDRGYSDGNGYPHERDRGGGFRGDHHDGPGDRR